MNLCSMIGQLVVTSYLSGSSRPVEDRHLAYFNRKKCGREPIEFISGLTFYFSSDKNREIVGWELGMTHNSTSGLVPGFTLGRNSGTF